jgi:hypothetical protein
MKRVWLFLSVFLLAACQSSNDDYAGMTGRVMLYQVDEAQFQRVLQGDAIIVIANPDSEWSQQAIPILNRVALEANRRVEYFNGVAFRQSNSQQVQDLIRQIQASSFLADYDARRYDELYLPIVLRVKQGQITLAHVGTVPGHFMVDSEIPPLTSDQQATLQSLYQSFFD